MSATDSTSAPPVRRMIPEMDLATAQQMVEQLQQQLQARHPGAPVQCLQTHISWVLLAGDKAYKLRKPLNLGFLDYSTRALRRHGSEEELRLNRRTAPELYEALVPITGTPQQPVWGGDGEAIDYAVQMRRFEQDGLLAVLAARGELQPEQLDALALQVAQMHAVAEVSAPGAPHGDPMGICHAAADNFGTLRGRLHSADERAMLQRLLRWTRAESARLAPLFQQRWQQGWIRECHGDLHLGNLVLLQGKPVPFDAIEFSPAFRWVDVMADLAFLVMDLLHRDRPDLAWRVLNTWLEQTGDYAGLETLRYFLVYRALVRAKVAALQGLPEATAYLQLADRLSQPSQPRLWIMHGLSGSGKSYQAQALSAHTGAIRIRADVERKRLFGLAPLASSHGQADIYTAEASEQTYARLGQLAQQVLQAGYPVVLDATFMQQQHRAPMQQLAARLGVPFQILSLQATPELLRERVQQRQQQGQDASEADLAVLESQLAHVQPLAAEELPQALLLDVSQPVDWPRLLAE
ncbi:MAG: AAA family ATPase [Ramlibacter sp.]|nr:AAA family ATPase [Ramlibacter sp.]